MENQSELKENLKEKNSLMIMVKITALLYPAFLFYLFFVFNVHKLNGSFESTLSTSIVIFSIFWGPLLMIIGSLSYIARMSNISRIPSNSTLYEAIMLTTIQYGPLKIIMPDMDEEEIIEWIED